MAVNGNGWWHQRNGLLICAAALERSGLLVDAAALERNGLLVDAAAAETNGLLSPVPQLSATDAHGAAGGAASAAAG